MKPEFSTLLAVYFFLLNFGILFNWLITHAEKKGWLEGYTALAVAGGVLMTLGAVAVIFPMFALITLGAFCFSGTPMLVGSIYRHVRNREQAIKRMIDDQAEM
jgi:hypothetical protein